MSKKQTAIQIPVKVSNTHLDDWFQKRICNCMWAKIRTQREGNTS